MSDQTASECAGHLVLIARDLRQAGDARLVRLSGDGVASAGITLADELWLIALRLDGKSAMALAKEMDEREQPCSLHSKEGRPLDDEQGSS